MWFFKKKEKRSAASSLSPEAGFSPHEPAQPGSKSLDVAEFEFFLNCYFDGRASMSVLYAKCGGYRSESIDVDDLSSFLEKLYIAPKDIEESDKAAALSFFKRDLIIGLSNEERLGPTDIPGEFKALWEFTCVPDWLERPSTEFKRFEAVRNFLVRTNMNFTISGDERTPDEVIFDTVCAARDADIFAVIERLEERKTVLKPIFERAMRQGVNKYGEQDYDLLIGEVVDFINYCFPEGTLKFFYSVQPLGIVVGHIESWLHSGDDIHAIPDEPIEFEYWCASQLEKQGWSVRVSKASGDQGVDIEARHGDIFLAVQCKRYSKPIGNKAVQEVIAGRQFLGATAGCVIGTGGYTKSAVELARATDVLIVNASSIRDVSSLLGVAP